MRYSLALLLFAALFGFSMTTTASAHDPSHGYRHGGQAAGWCNIHDGYGRVVKQLWVRSAAECQYIGRQHAPRPAPPQVIIVQPTPMYGHRPPPYGHGRPYHHPRGGWAVGITGSF